MTIEGVDQIVKQIYQRDTLSAVSQAFSVPLMLYGTQDEGVPSHFEILKVVFLPRLPNLIRNLKPSNYPTVLQPLC